MFSTYASAMLLEMLVSACFKIAMHIRTQMWHSYHGYDKWGLCNIVFAAMKILVQSRNTEGDERSSQWRGIKDAFTG